MLDGIDPLDIEDIAIGSSSNIDYIYLADTGNNRRDRNTIQIYKFKEPNFPDAPRYLSLLDGPIFNVGTILYVKCAIVLYNL